MVGLCDSNSSGNPSNNIILVGENNQGLHKIKYMCVTTCFIFMIMGKGRKTIYHRRRSSITQYLPTYVYLPISFGLRYVAHGNNNYERETVYCYENNHFFFLFLKLFSPVVIKDDVKKKNRKKKLGKHYVKM